MGVKIQISRYKMAIILGQRRKAKAALERIIASITHAHSVALAGNHQSAISLYDEIIKTLQSEAYQQWRINNYLPQKEWTDRMASAMLGRIKMFAGLDTRPVFYEQAERMIFDVFAIKPNWTEANEFMADLALSRGHKKSAAHYIKGILSTNPRHPHARVMQASLDFADGKYEAVIRNLSEIKGTPKSFTFLARCHLRTGNPEMAVNLLNQALQSHDPSYELHYYLGCAYAHVYDLAEAKVQFEKALALESQGAEALIQLGHIAYLIGQPKEAEKYYMSSINLGGRNAQDARYGLALMSANHPEIFKTYLENLLLFDNQSELLYCAKGDQFERAGKTEAAISEYNSVSPDSKWVPALLTRIGFMKFRSRDYFGALPVLRKAAELRPADVRLLDLLGINALLNGDYQLATTTWKNLAARNQANEKTLRALKQAELWSIVEGVHHGKTHELIEPLEKFYQETGEGIKVGNALADLYFISAITYLEQQTPDTERAKECLLHGKHINTNIRFDYLQALADLMAGQAQTAIHRLKALLGNNTGNPGASYHLGIAFQQMGNNLAAEEALQKGITALPPDSPKANRMKWALAVLLAKQQRWHEVKVALEGYEDSIQLEGIATPAQFMELKITALAMTDSWEEAERMAIGTNRQQQTMMACVILTRRNLKTDRLEAALTHAGNYFSLSKNSPNTNLALNRKMEYLTAQIALKSAAIYVRNSRYVPNSRLTLAEDVLRQALATLTDANGSPETQSKLNGFLMAISQSDEKAKILSENYSSLRVEVDLDKEDLVPPDIEIPVVLPTKTHKAFDLLEKPQFNPLDWDASIHPDPLIVFDS
jgi:Flp pilus assembly protein TadD